MLLAVLVEAMMSRGRPAEFVEVVLSLRCSLRFLAPTVASMKTLDEFSVGLVAVLTFRVLLRALLLALLTVHCDLAV
jgi:hypothetical protein